MDALDYQLHKGSLQLHLQSLSDDVVEAGAGALLIVLDEEDHEPEEQHVLFLVVPEYVADNPHAHAGKIKRNPILEVVQIVGLVLAKD